MIGWILAAFMFGFCVGAIAGAVLMVLGESTSRQIDDACH